VNAGDDEPRQMTFDEDIWLWLSTGTGEARANHDAELSGGRWVYFKKSGKRVYINPDGIILSENGKGRHISELGEYYEEQGVEGGKVESEKEYSDEVTKLLGTEYKGVKGQAAINKLLQEKNGHVKAAFHRKGIGDIGILWGDDTVGLQHIISKRAEEGFDGESFLYEIPNVIENGTIKKQANGRFRLSLGDKRAIISPELRGDKVTFLLTAYETY
jgi:hypothetical protein